MPSQDLEAAMRPATSEMPEDEQMVRRFLARYRAPAPASCWTEAHVAHLLRRIRRERSWRHRG